MSGEVGAIKAAMEAAFRAFIPTGLDIYPYVPSTMHLPALCIGEVEIAPSRTMGNLTGPGMEEMTFTVSVFTSTADDEDGQRELDRLISRDGPVRQALWSMRGAPGQEALTGAADDIHLTGISGYGMISVGDNGSLYGATLSVRVIVS